MDGEASLTQSHTPRGRTAQRLILRIALVLLALVVSAVIWLCIGVNHFGRYTLIGPGFGAPVRIADHYVRATPGWYRTLYLVFPETTLDLQFPGDPFNYSSPQPIDRLYRSKDRPARIEVRYYAGFVLLEEIPTPPARPAAERSH